MSGLLFRLSAAGGLALSVLFWLTASWATKPYYYGPDLPYALGWLTLALAGTGGRFTIEAWLDREFDGGLADEPVSPERRLVLKTGFLGVVALVVAGLAGTVGASALGRQRIGVKGTNGSVDTGDATDGAVPSGATPSFAADASAAPTSPGASIAPGSTPTPVSGPLVAKVSQLASGRPVTFNDPITGDPGVIIKLRDAGAWPTRGACHQPASAQSWSISNLGVVRGASWQKDTRIHPHQASHGIPPPQIRSRTPDPRLSGQLLRALRNRSLHPRANVAGPSSVARSRDGGGDVPRFRPHEEHRAS